MNNLDFKVYERFGTSCMPFKFNPDHIYTNVCLTQEDKQVQRYLEYRKKFLPKFKNVEYLYGYVLAMIKFKKLLTLKHFDWCKFCQLEGIYGMFNDKWVVAK